MSQILSESRKFGLHLTLAHQTLGQLESSHLIAALGNIGTQVVFAVDRGDAEIMAKKLFSVEVEEIKHEVPNKAQQGKMHPLYYSVQEEWEQAIQTIQGLSPRYLPRDDTTGCAKDPNDDSPPAQPFRDGLGISQGVVIRAARAA